MFKAKCGHLQGAGTQDYWNAKTSGVAHDWWKTYRDETKYEDICTLMTMVCSSQRMCCWACINHTGEQERDTGRGQGCCGVKKF